MRRKLTANRELREAMDSKKMPVWVLADAVKVSEVTMCRYLRHELNKETKAAYMRIVDQYKG